MAELKALAWILIGLAVFIWRMVQKARTTTAREQRERPRTTGRPAALPAGSFDELLKQFQTQNQPAARPVPPATTMGGRPLPAEAAPRPRSLEKTEAPARSLERSAAPHLLEAPRRAVRRAATLPRAANQPNPDDYWSRQPGATPEARPPLGELLRNPGTLRTAFLLGEILQRRF
ncbi:hypothetical protein [Hymenobacter metallilatus]|uniref:Uncharacterized protein n=1 Tax=Hymenobacter metallilatus TaxID=2493666 RepID=A0A3R9LPD4_9BACT|nr:hypothetical protein [Hymenobacter metallilatus]RSK24172.1 hypothetical protein EI290_20535 [Hymenobacter metallilatus]